MLRLREDLGLSHRACLDFDVACVSFDERFQQELDATKEVPLTPEEIRQRDNAKPTRTVPLHSHAALLRFLGLDDDGDASHQIDPDVMQDAADWFSAGGLA